MAKPSVNSTLLKAKTHAKMGEIEEAQNLYQAVLQAFPKNKRAQQGLATLKKTKLPTINKSPPQKTINNLLNLYNQGQLSSVVKEAQAIIRKYPAAFVAWNVLGAAAAQTEQLDNAIFAFQKVLDIKPNNPEAYYNMGKVFQDQGKLEEAIDAYRKAFSLKPDYADAYNNMGNALKVQGKLDEAVKAYKKALAIKPDYGEAKHILSSLTGETTNSAPRDYVENLFDDYANKFDNSLLQKLEYKIPKTLSLNSP